MRSKISVGLLVAFSLSACDQAGLGLANMPKQSPTARNTAHAAPSATPAPTTSASPSATPTPTPRPSATPTPIGPATLIKGLVQIDANYVIAAGGGNLVSTGSGSVIAAGGGNVIAAGGGNVIAAGGGNVIAAGGGNILAGGTSLFRLLEAASVPLGTILPVKGMVVVPVSMLTWRQIGEAVKTDEKGAYTLAIPESVWKSAGNENIRLYAAVPGENERSPAVTNPRFRYQVIVTATADAKQIDEDSALVTSFIRTMARNKMAFVFSPERIAQAEAAAGDPSKSPLFDERFNPMQQAIVNQFADKLISSAKQHHVPESRYGQVAERLADMVLAKMSLEAAPLITTNQDPAKFKYIYTGDEKMVLPAMLKLMTRIRTLAAEKMKGDPEFFNQLEFVKSAALPPDNQPYRILKPADVCEFAVRKYFSSDALAFRQVGEELFPVLGMSQSENDETRGLLNVAAWSLITQMGVRFLAMDAEMSGVDTIMADLGQTP